VSRERVRQIEKRLLKKLKAYLQTELSETVVEVYESP
jgi:DNA-directed RNA polymerase sigma subunit (sigma70/sigma32)